MRYVHCVYALAMLARGLVASPASDVASCVAEGWKLRLWSLYPVEKLRADENLPAEPKSTVIAISAARDEREPFVLALRSDVPLRHVCVSGGALQGEGSATLPASIWSFRRMAYIHVDEPSGSRIKSPMPYPTGTGDFPDPLLSPCGDSRPGRNLQFFVVVSIPPSTAPGRFTGTLTVAFRREGWMPADTPSSLAVPVELTVRRFTLPPVPPLLNTTVASPQNLPAWMDRTTTMASLRHAFAVCGQTPDPLPSPVLRLSHDGSLSVDSTAWETAAAELLDQGHASHLFLPVWNGTPSAPMQGVYFLWHYPAVTQQRWLGATICDAKGDLTPDFQARFGAYLRHMHALLKRRGWLPRTFLTTMDEPYTYHLHGEDRARDTPENNARVIASYVRFVRTVAPGLRTFATADPTPALNGLIDHWCLRNLTHAAEARERAERYGERVTFCDNYRTFIDYPAVSSRSLGWLAWKIGASGWLTYECLGNISTAWEGPAFVYPLFSGGTVWGMGQLFYPDLESQGGLAPSLRWELMREGCDDYAYLWLLRSLLDRLPPNLREESAAQEARRLLASAAASVVGGSGDAETASAAPAPNAVSNRVPHDLRRRLGDLIEQFTPPETP